MKILVGLGNPGEKYIFTPHNIGWIILDALASHLSTSLNTQWNFKKKFSAKIAVTDQQHLLLVKPQTYMNLSGIAVKNIMQFYRLHLDDLLVIHDDIDLPFLSLKFQKNRSSAGHNGLKSIHQELGSQNYARLRVGMKTPAIEGEGTPLKIPSQTSVLKPFTKAQINLLPNFLNTAVESILYFNEHDIHKTANRYN